MDTLNSNSYSINGHLRVCYIFTKWVVLLQSWDLSHMAPTHQTGNCVVSLLPPFLDLQPPAPWVCQVHGWPDAGSAASQCWGADDRSGWKNSMVHRIGCLLLSLKNLMSLMTTRLDSWSLETFLTWNQSMFVACSKSQVNLLKIANLIFAHTCVWM